MVTWGHKSTSTKVINMRNDKSITISKWINTFLKNGTNYVFALIINWIKCRMGLWNNSSRIWILFLCLKKFRCVKFFLVKCLYTWAPVTHTKELVKYKSQNPLHFHKQYWKLGLTPAKHVVIVSPRNSGNQNLYVW